VTYAAITEGLARLKKTYPDATKISFYALDGESRPIFGLWLDGDEKGRKVRFPDLYVTPNGSGRRRKT
jgi:hypothetical protein